MTTAFDYYSPYMSAAIVNTLTGDRYPLWTNVDPAVLERAGARPELRALCYLETLTVQLDLGPIPLITLLFNAPYREGLALLDSGIIAQGFSRVEAQLGYTTSLGGQAILSPLFLGTVQDLEVGISGEGVNITVTAQGVGAYDAVRARSPRVFETPTPRVDIIRTILRGSDPDNPRDMTLDTSRVEALREGADNAAAGVAAFIDALGASGASQVAEEIAASVLTGTEYTALFEDPITYNQGWRTDWWAIWGLVRECRCTMLLLGDALQIIPMNAQMGTEPVRVFRLFDFPNGAVGPGTNTMPILEFQTEATHQYAPAALKGIALSNIDSASREEVAVFVDDESARTSRTGAGSAGLPETSDNPGRDNENFSGGDWMPGRVDPRTVQAIQAEYDAFTMNLGINATIKTLGDPTLIPADIVEVRGVGRRTEGNYAILGLTHRSGSDGYNTEVQVVSNVGQLLQQSAAQLEVPFPQGPENTQEAPTEGSNSSPPPAPNTNNT